MTPEETTLRLFKMLKEILDDRNFVVGVMSNASRTDERKALIRFIEKGEDVTADNLLLLSLHMAQNRT